jgi:tetratricopeptide (TPR) repeat protein
MKAKKGNIDRLYDQLSDSIDKHPGSAQTLTLANQLEVTLSEAKDKDVGAIFGEECRALIHEAKGNVQNAINHREDEIRLIRRLHKISRNSPGEAFAFGQYGFSDLRDRLELLAVLYHDSGQLAKALSALEEAKQLCLDHDIPFDAEDVLREYSEERPSQTLYLWVSENGVLSAKEASSGLQATMPSANVAEMGQAQDTTHPAKIVSPRAMQHHIAGESAITIEDD